MLWWEGVYFSPFYFCFCASAIKSAVDLAHAEAKSSFHTCGRLRRCVFFLILFFAFVFHD